MKKNLFDQIGSKIDISAVAKPIANIMSEMLNTTDRTDEVKRLRKALKDIRKLTNESRASEGGMSRALVCRVHDLATDALIDDQD